MIDRFFTPVLTFGLLLGGTLAIGSAMFGLDRDTAALEPVTVVQLQQVVVTAKRLAPNRIVAAKGVDEAAAASAQ
jgi:hypothetical protein